MELRFIACVTAVSVLLAPIASASQDGGGSGSPTEPPRCDAAEHRQFDFWIGEWEVVAPDGKVAGRNTITRMLDGCVIHEQWTGGGTRGESFNIWDRTRRQWHQRWVSDRGDLLLPDGGVENGAMRMTGESGPPDRRVRHRMTWTPLESGLRQLWEVSSDGGATWRTVFDGTYRPVPR